MDLNKLDAQMLKFDLESKTGWNVTIFFKSNRGGLSETVYSNLSIKVTIFFSDQLFLCLPFIKILNKLHISN